MLNRSVFLNPVSVAKKQFPNIHAYSSADQWPDKTGPARKKNLSLHFGKRVYRFNHRPSSLLVPSLDVVALDPHQLLWPIVRYISLYIGTIVRKEGQAELTEQNHVQDWHPLGLDGRHGHESSQNQL